MLNFGVKLSAEQHNSGGNPQPDHYANSCAQHMFLRNSAAPRTAVLSPPIPSTPVVAGRRAMKGLPPSVKQWLQPRAKTLNLPVSALPSKMNDHVDRPNAHFVLALASTAKTDTAEEKSGGAPAKLVLLCSSRFLSPGEGKDPPALLRH
jgi:hypothetical protein